MIKNLVRNFLRIDKPTDDLVRDINEERAELHQRKAQLDAQLVETEVENLQVPNPDLLDALRMGRSESTSSPKTSLDSSSNLCGSNFDTAGTRTSSNAR